jgi:hypothetical protein
MHIVVFLSAPRQGVRTVENLVKLGAGEEGKGKMSRVKLGGYKGQFFLNSFIYAIFQTATINA